MTYIIRHRIKNYYNLYHFGARFTNSYAYFSYICASVQEYFPLKCNQIPRFLELYCKLILPTLFGYLNETKAKK